MPKTEYQQVADSDAAASAAVELILQQAATAIAKRGRFVFALCGGRTPQGTGKLTFWGRRNLASLFKQPPYSIQ